MSTWPRWSVRGPDCWRATDRHVAQVEDGRKFVIENQYGRGDHDHLTRGLAYAVARRSRGLVVVAEEHRDEFRAVAQYLKDLAEQDPERGAPTRSRRMATTPPSPRSQQRCWSRLPISEATWRQNASPSSTQPPGTGWNANTPTPWGSSTSRGPPSTLCTADDTWSCGPALEAATVSPCSTSALH